MAQQCPFCNHELHILPDMADKKVVCASCHQDFIASPSIMDPENFFMKTATFVCTLPDEEEVPANEAEPNAETDDMDDPYGALARRYNTCGYGAGIAGALCASFEAPPILALLCWIGCLILSILALRNMSDYQRSESLFGRTVKGTSCCNTLISIGVIIAYLSSMGGN